MDSDNTGSPTDGRGWIGQAMSAIVFYKIAATKTRDDLIAAYPRHRARVDRFLASGKIVTMGALTSPTTDGVGSIGVFSSKADADAFVKEDPFVLEGMVGSYEVAEFTDIAQA